MKKFMFMMLAFVSASVFAAPANTEILPNGVKVTHLGMGTGVKPQATSLVKVTYKGTFQDGRLFDQSLAPISFQLNQVIPCWTTALQTMKVGGVAKLECPSDTAYGPRGAGNAIPPNTPLNFIVKLIEIE